MHRKTLATTLYFFALLVLAGKFITAPESRDFMVIVGVLLISGGLLVEHFRLEAKKVKKKK